MWFAGIDWADRHHDAAVVTAGGEVVGRLRVAHSAEGLEQLIAFLQQRTPKGEQLACVVEIAHGLLIAALLEAGRCRLASGSRWRNCHLASARLAHAGREWPPACRCDSRAHH
jgi:Transposase